MSAPTAETPPDDLVDAAQQPHWRTVGLRPRVTAVLVDGFIASIAALLPTAMLFLLVHDPGYRIPDDRVDPIMAFGTWLGATAYFGLLEGRWGQHNGQTPGKRQHNIRTVTARGGVPIGRTRALIRGALIALLVPGILTLGGVAQLVVGSDVATVDLGRMLTLTLQGLMVGIAAMQLGRRSPIDWICGTAVVADTIVPQNAALLSVPTPTQDVPPQPSVRVAHEMPLAGVGQPLRPLPLSGRPRDRAEIAVSVVTTAVGLWALSEYLT